jgi:hypothetical protein
MILVMVLINLKIMHYILIDGAGRDLMDNAMFSLIFVVEEE